MLHFWFHLGSKAQAKANVLKAGFLKNVVLRNWVNFLICMVPMVGGIYGIVDILLIFRADCRCIHDFIAGTRVVQAEQAVLAVS